MMTANRFLKLWAGLLCLAVGVPTAHAENLIAYEFTATIPASYPLPEWAGVTMVGSFVIDLDVVVPWMNGEGTTSPRLFTVTFSNGASFTTTSDWGIVRNTNSNPDHIVLHALSNPLFDANGNLDTYEDSTQSTFEHGGQLWRAGIFRFWFDVVSIYQEATFSDTISLTGCCPDRFLEFNIQWQRPNGTWIGQGADLPFDLYPVMPPVYVERSSWGRVKRRAE